MTFFQFFYCKAYKYYNVGNKSDTTLRGSAIIAMSTLQATNVFSVLILLNVFLDGAIYLNKWICGGLVVATGILNCSPNVSCVRDAGSDHPSTDWMKEGPNVSRVRNGGSTSLATGGVKG